MSRLEKLPAELRHQIFSYCVVSPTGYLEPIDLRGLRCPKDTSLSGTYSFYLACNTPLDRDSMYKWSITGLDNPRLRNKISTSLLRTNKQIHAEASSIFWNSNTIFFFDIEEMVEFETKAGSVPFRNIVTMCVGLNERAESLEWQQIEGILQQLSKSRSTSDATSKSSLKKLELAISKRMINFISKWSLSENINHANKGMIKDAIIAWYLLKTLERGKELGSGIERCVVLGKEQVCEPLEAVDLDKMVELWRQAWGKN
ncbi:uncharacterized protein LY89DRAFT_736451 [Mollisia scopiformis]|uniref:Uncharacterized protein n=1 Tax=Mollisia scopiformis TaxID=149040 RepID=A0A194X3L1_MOLSC|nr:uncharacterized protein LY89DRAFT_736451 [Mollisia scopiformis]KUJ14412.1 hypothetical protein LY89DRAFT_736451 [Mollisia scopiformis]